MSASTRNKAPPPSPPSRPRIPVGALVRMFLVGSLAVGASVYGVYRYYFVPRAWILAPAPSVPAVPATEIPAPELVPSG